ncbi:MAG: NADH-quinone oxidoreductase subunit M [Vulcanimicrobiota bacterium]
MMVSLLVGLPVVCGLAAYLMKEVGSRGFALLVMAIQMGIAVSLMEGAEAARRVHQVWIPELGLNWSLALDGANVLLVLLTPLLCFLAVLAAPRELENPAGLAGGILLLNGFLSGLFLAQNLGLFYLFFEAMLLPTLMLVSAYARKEGPETALKFLMFTLVGSLPMLLGVLILAYSPDVAAPNLDFESLQGKVPVHRQIYLFFPFLLAFLVKMPMVPFHGWLPSLYRNSPACVTVIIAGLMSKAGTYGLMKVGLLVFPGALNQLGPSLGILAVITIIYGALSALGSDSLREILAYSSLSHLGMIAFGLTSSTANGIAGATLQMAAHAVATGGLFLVVALLERRHMPDRMRRFGGLAEFMPRLAALALFLTLASLGQPGLGSFPGELMILTGTWPAQTLLTVLATLGIVLAAAYLLRWYQRVFTGPIGTYREPQDLDSLETFVLLVPITVTLLIGFCPALFLTPIQTWLEGVL